MLLQPLSILSPPNARTKAPRRPKLHKMSRKDLKRLGDAVSNRLATCANRSSPNYLTLTNVFKHAILEFMGRNCDRPSNRFTSPATQDLQQRFCTAIVQKQRDRTDFSYFVVDNLEKLLNAQHEHEKAVKTDNWLKKLNVLDFKNRTRSFFSELRKKYNVTQRAGHITDSGGVLSNNLDTKLNNIRICIPTVNPP